MSINESELQKEFNALSKLGHATNKWGQSIISTLPKAAMQAVVDAADDAVYSPEDYVDYMLAQKDGVKLMGNEKSIQVISKMLQASDRNVGIISQFVDVATLKSSLVNEPNKSELKKTAEKYKLANIAKILS